MDEKRLEVKVGGQWREVPEPLFNLVKEPKRMICNKHFYFIDKGQLYFVKYAKDLDNKKKWITAK